MSDLNAWATSGDPDVSAAAALLRIDSGIYGIRRGPDDEAIASAAYTRGPSGGAPGAVASGDGAGASGDGAGASGGAGAIAAAGSTPESRMLSGVEAMHATFSGRVACDKAISPGRPSALIELSGICLDASSDGGETEETDMHIDFIDGCPWTLGRH